jgi:hypothetical protein
MAGEVAFAGLNASIVLGGVIAPGTVVAAGTSPFQRVYIGDAGKVEVNLTSANFSATVTHKINLYGVFPPHRMSGDLGLRTSAPLASATIVSTFTTLSAVTYQFQMVDVEIAATASSPVTIAGAVIVGTGGPST